MFDRDGGMMQKKVSAKILAFLHFAERLKKELRHGWTSNGRQESVAEHSWRLSLMIILCSPYLNQRLDIEKTLKMAIIHDLVEAKTGDIPFFEAPDGSEKKENKQKAELQAIEEIREFLNDAAGNEIYELWMEYEASNSYEAKIVKALDKIEAQVQQNEADLETWIEYEKESALTYLNPYCSFDSLLSNLMTAVREESIVKMEKV